MIDTRMTGGRFSSHTEAEEAIKELQRENCDALSALPLQSITQADYPLSSTQVRLWLLEQITPELAVHSQPIAISLPQDVDLAILHQSLQEIIRRHSELRSRFSIVDGQPRQEILPALTLDLPLVEVSSQTVRSQNLAEEFAQIPFDLSQGGLIRGTIFRFDAATHILLLVTHHLVFDSWSTGILLQELNILYTAFSQGEPSPLPELPIQYSDFALWQQQSLTIATEKSQRELAFWRKYLEGAPPLLELPIDRLRPPQQTYRGAKETLTLPPELGESLAALSQQSKVTLFVTLLAAFGTLLHRYTGAIDLVIGCPVAGRNLPETENLIGAFINTLPLRLCFQGNPSFSDLLQQVQATSWQALTHQDLPLEKIIEALQPERNPSYHPLFQVGFVLEPPKPDLEIGLAKNFPIHNGSSKFDLTLGIEETALSPDPMTAKGIVASLEYSTDLFDRPTVTRMVGHFQTLLTAIVTNPEQRISDLPLLTATEEELFREWNHTQRDYSQDQSIQQLFEMQVERTPDAVAVVCRDQELTYRELNTRSNQLAHYLRSLGVKSDFLVGICVDRSLDMIIGLLGVLKAGGAYVPLDPVYPIERLEQMVADAQISILLTQQPILHRLPPHQAQVICLDNNSQVFAEHSSENPVSKFTPQDLAYVIYTSGSTGKPKGVLIQQQSVVNFIQGALQEYGLHPGDRFLQFVSYSFDVAVEEIYPTLICGATVVLRTDEMLNTITTFLQKCQEWQITVLDMPTAYWHQLTAALASYQLTLPPSLRLVIIIGERAIPAQFKLWQHHVGKFPQLINAYGPTEATVAMTTCDLSMLDPTHQEREVSIGRPMQNSSVYILDQNLHQVPVGIAGELHIGGVGLARGYLNRPDLTNEKFIPNPFDDLFGGRLYKTGDLVRYLPDGSLEVIGRKDFQVKIRGFRIELGEVESILAQHPAIEQTVVIAREDTAGDKYLVAYITPENLGISINELRQFLKQKLPDYMMPSAFVTMKALPINAMGKVDRRALPKPDFLPIEPNNYLAPQTETEAAIARIWAEVLQLERIGIQDNFFDLGGHSLSAIRVITRLQEVLGVSLSLRYLFEFPTIEALASQVEALGYIPRAATNRDMDGRATNSVPDHQNHQKLSPQILPILPLTNQEPIPASFAQKRLRFLDQLNPRSGFYNIPTALRLQGQLNYQALYQSMQEIVRRHAALRTNFLSLEGETIQVIAPTLDIDLPVVDLQTLAAIDRELEIKHLINTEVAKPFNLSQEPLIRFLLLQWGTTEQILVVTIHHIIADGWSMGIFIEELTAVYGATLAGKASPLPELTIQYPDFAVWQLHWLQSGVLEPQIGYWQKQLANAPRLLELPYDRPRPAKQNYRGTTQSFSLPIELSEAIHLLSRQQNATVFMTLLAAFQTLLFRYTQSPDICIGSPVANRHKTEIEGLIGFFVNTLVLRTNLAGEPSFIELLGRVKDIALEAYDHQDVPLEKLVEILEPPRSLSYAPLFQVMFVLQNAGTTTWELEGLTIEQLPVETGTAKFDLTLSMEETKTGLVGNWEYNTNLFDDATITRMAGHFQTLLEGIIADPQERITHLPLMPESEQQLLQVWNQTQTNYPREATIHELFEAQVEQTPEAIALVLGDQEITYQELNQKANQLAHHLQTLGVKPEVTVGLCLERSLSMLVATLAILKAGGVYVPLDPAYPMEPLAFMFTDAQVEILLTDSKLVSQLPPHQAMVTERSRSKVICLDTSSTLIIPYSTENLPKTNTATNLAYIIYTSGSTGQPKGVCVTHQGVVRLVKGNNYAQLDSKDVFLQLAPTAFDAATLEIWGSLLNGAKLVLAPPHKVSLGELGQLIQRHHITTLWLTAGLFHLMVDERLGDLQPLRQLLAGGDILSVPQVQRFLQAHPHCQLINGYGPTENTTFTCCYPVNEVITGEKSIPIGRPIANTQVYILDPQLQQVPLGVPGELYIGGDGLARGYLHRPDLTEERFIPNPFNHGTYLYKTGDAVRYLTDGNIEFLGRLDNQVKIRGFRIELGEVESILGQHPQVQQTVVLAKEDTSGDKYLVAYVTLSVDSKQLAVNKNTRIGSDYLLFENFRQFLKHKLPDYMMPSAFIILEDFPLNAVGKVDRRALPNPNELNQESGETNFAPRDQVESQLVEIWSQVLGKPRIGIRDRFFEDLGGSSLKAARLFLRIEEAFGKALPLAILYEAPTVEELAKIIRQQKWSPSWLSLIPIQPQGNKIPLFCIHPGGGNVLCYRTLAPYLGADQPVYGLQSRGLDGQEEAIENIEVMAKNYLQEMQTVQAQGPYILAGYSLGGTIAYEIAQQLQQAGQEVAAVILFDAISPQSLQQGTTTLVEKLKLHNANLRKLSFPGQWGYFYYRWNLKLKSVQANLKALMYHLQGQANPDTIADHLLKLDATNHQALLRYEASPYEGKVVLFETIERPTDIYYDPGLGWTTFMKGQLEIIDDIPGHHGTMLEEPYVAILGKKLKAYLEQFNANF